MQIDDVTAMLDTLPGVRGSVTPGQPARWSYHGRLVARQIDATHLVIRTHFDVRDALLRQFPATFGVPSRYAAHMMIVADLAGGDAGAIEDALVAAWELQRAADQAARRRPGRDRTRPWHDPRRDAVRYRIGRRTGSPRSARRWPRPVPAAR